jgi:hypothetical protein
MRLVERSMTGKTYGESRSGSGLEELACEQGVGLVAVLCRSGVGGMPWSLRISHMVDRRP